MSLDPEEADARMGILPESSGVSVGYTEVRSSLAIRMDQLRVNPVRIARFGDSV